METMPLRGIVSIAKTLHSHFFAHLSQPQRQEPPLRLLRIVANTDAPTIAMIMIDVINIYAHLLFPKSYLLTYYSPDNSGNQGNDIRKRTLIAYRKPSPPRTVHLSPNRSDCRKTRYAQ